MSREEWEKHISQRMNNLSAKANKVYMEERLFKLSKTQIVTNKRIKKIKPPKGLLSLFGLRADVF